jgi:hypothetical protein
MFLVGWLELHVVGCYDSSNLSHRKERKKKRSSRLDDWYLGWLHG